ncbi:hypothetical protein ASPCAL04202 [Aspergillus calidoustus]|uniref:Uncharacterized protein n=1 Tax=Aspergillus calidoustus TaxID=454130 RepID=A0A0U5GQI2_ASPCI|nr:hypothetical protein ASPCAL04202 [Aspergillus calidoustus]
MDDKLKKTDDTVITKLYYLTPLEEYKTTKPYYVNWPVDDISGARQTNLSHTAYEDIKIEDIRGAESSLCIDVEGFQLAKHATHMRNEEFEKDIIVRQKYYPEIREFVKETLNASRVFIFEHTVCPVN